jgi:hypothetical protein
MAIVSPPPETIIVTPEQAEEFRRLLQDSIREHAAAEEASKRARARNVKLASGARTAAASGIAAAYALIAAAAAAPLISALVDALTDTDTDTDIAKRRRKKTYKCAAVILQIIESTQAESEKFAVERALETNEQERRKSRTFRSRA